MRRRFGFLRSREEGEDQERGGVRSADQMQGDMRPVGPFRRIFDYLDRNPIAGYPDTARAGFGSRYQLVQMLSLRDPCDARLLVDNMSVPYQLRLSADVREEQRMGMSPGPSISPYNLQDWHAKTYQGMPEVGAGPGTTFVVPQSQFAD